MGRYAGKRKEESGEFARLIRHSMGYLSENINFNTIRVKTPGFQL